MTIECRLSHNLPNLTKQVIKERIVEIKKSHRTTIYLTLLNYDEKELTILLHNCNLMNMGEIQGLLLELMHTQEYTMTSSYITPEELLFLIESYPLSQEEKNEWIEHFKQHQSPPYIGLSSHECHDEISKIMDSKKIRDYIQELKDSQKIIKGFIHKHILYRSYDHDSGFELASSLARSLYSQKLLVNPKVMLLDVELHYVEESTLDFSSIESDVHGGVLIIKVRDMNHGFDEESVEEMLFSWVDWLESIRHSTLIMFWFVPTHVSILESMVLRSSLLRLLELSRDYLDDEKIEKWQYRKLSNHHHYDLFKKHIHLEGITTFQELKRVVNADYDAYYYQGLDKKRSRNKQEISEIQKEVCEKLRDAETHVVILGKEERLENQDYEVITKHLSDYGILKRNEYIILNPRSFRSGNYERRLRDIKTACLKNRDKLIIIEDTYILDSLHEASVDAWNVFERLVKHYSIKAIVLSNKY
jgi:hypothetical protein